MMITTIKVDLSASKRVGRFNSGLARYRRIGALQRVAGSRGAQQENRHRSIDLLSEMFKEEWISFLGIINQLTL